MNKKLSSLMILAALGLSACSKEETKPTVEAPTAKVEQSTKEAAHNHDDHKHVEKEVKVADVKPQNADAKKIDYVEDVHYRVVKNINTDGLTAPFLVEYFWLGCPHCQTFEPLLKGFTEANPDVQILKKHAVLDARWGKDARVFYALKEMNKMEHFDELFNLYKIKKMPTKQDIEEFLTLKNIDKDEFFNIADKSEKVLKNIEESLQEMVGNKITGVPAIVVNGKYFVLPSKDIVSVKDYFDLVNYLLSK